jgi:hypothetical protein
MFAASITTPPTALKPEGPDPDGPVVLTSARSEIEAQRIADDLREIGIEARVIAAAGNMLQWEAGMTQPIKVMVRRRDAIRALGLLRDIKSPRGGASASVDWERIDVGELEPGVSPAPVSTPASERSRRLRKARMRRIGWMLMTLPMTGWAIAAGYGAQMLAFIIVVAVLSWNDEV